MNALPEDIRHWANMGSMDRTMRAQGHPAEEVRHCLMDYARRNAQHLLPELINTLAVEREMEMNTNVQDPLERRSREALNQNMERLAAEPIYPARSPDDEVSPEINDHLRQAAYEAAREDRQAEATAEAMVRQQRTCYNLIENTSDIVAAGDYTAAVRWIILDPQARIRPELPSDERAMWERVAQMVAVLMSANLSSDTIYEQASAFMRQEYDAYWVKWKREMIPTMTMWKNRNNKTQQEEKQMQIPKEIQLLIEKHPASTVTLNLIRSTTGQPVPQDIIGDSQKMSEWLEGLESISWTPPTPVPHTPRREENQYFDGATIDPNREELSFDYRGCVPFSVDVVKTFSGCTSVYDKITIDFSDLPEEVESVGELEGEIEGLVDGANYPDFDNGEPEYDDVDEEGDINWDTLQTDEVEDIESDFSSSVFRTMAEWLIDNGYVNLTEPEDE